MTSRPGILGTFLMTMVLLSAPVPARSSGNPLPVLGEGRREQLRKTLDEQMEKYAIPGAIVGMWFPGIGDWTTSAGVNNVGGAAIPDKDVRVRIGSITKSFTATVVLQLVDEGKLSLDDALGRWDLKVPGAEGITVQQLLNMTSGLFNYTDVPEFWEALGKDRLVEWTPQSLVALAVANPPVFPPGREFMYCNTNYILLGMIIEAVTGRTAAEEITTRIIDRLNMKNTSFPMDSGIQEPYLHGNVPAKGEEDGSGALEDLSICSPSPYWTAGGMISTLDDLNIWIKAIMTGEVLSPAMHAEQLNFSAPNTESYGLGVMNGGGAMVGHSGEVPGYNSSMYFLPQLGAISITLINRYPSAVEGAADQVNLALIQAMTADSAFGYRYPDPADFSSLPWVEAFKAMHEKFSREYAFGVWKGVDWPVLYGRFLPRVAEAQAAGDEKAYYRALHEYICSIPDGHISLGAKNAAIPDAVAKELAGGGFGLALAELDDWSVIAAAVAPEGPAALAGIKAGAEIVSWDGLPIWTALNRVDVGAVPFKRLTGAVGGENPKATDENYRLEQYRLLGRGPVGRKVDVEFRNPGTAGSRTTTLEAVDDSGKTFSLLDFAARPEFSSKVDYRILPEGYGYVLVRMEYDPSNPGYPIRVYDQFKEAIASFAEAKVPGVIVDMRGNYGGSDQLAADMCGFFYDTPSFYEKQEYYDKRSGGFLPLTLSENDSSPFVDFIAIEPQAPRYGGPVVVLVNPGTTSSGEGVPACLAKLPKGKVIGFHGTNGSFGMVGGMILLPGGYSIGYPFGRSVDRNGIVQLDSRNGIGGARPNLRVPKTAENVLAFAAGTDVELEYALKYLSGL